MRVSSARILAHLCSMEILVDPGAIFLPVGIYLFRRSYVALWAARFILMAAILFCSFKWWTFLVPNRIAPDFLIIALVLLLINFIVLFTFLYLLFTGRTLSYFPNKIV